MQYRFFPLFLFLLFLTGCASSPTKDTIFLPQIFNLPCIFLERTIEPYDTSNYLPYASLRENAPSITTFYPLPFTGDIHTSYAYNLGYLPADFHTISLQCTNREYYAPIDNP
ncbi:MAG: hypothetical protein LBP53_04255 [Candidatus Peribacteria bacterium]|nr:hypothetical protein [Candidatus Peribacteria bacterium]